jgi:hypothetical protein
VDEAIRHRPRHVPGLIATIRGAAETILSLYHGVLPAYRGVPETRAGPEKTPAMPVASVARKVLLTSIMRARWFRILPFIVLASCGSLAHIDDRYGATDVDGAQGADARVPTETGPNDSGESPDATMRDDTGSADDGALPPSDVSDALDGDASEVDADAADVRGDVGADVAEAGDAAGDSPEESEGGPPLPTSIDAAHLRLWLTADKGVACSTGVGFGRVISWADQSGNHDDASLQHSQLGPQCELANDPHRVNGVDLPYFTAPGEPDGGLIVDETLDVNLDFLAKSDYTAFVVERRWADYADGDVNGEFFLGTREPANIELANPSQCGQFPNDIVFAFGYSYWGNASLTLDQGCNTLSAPTTRLSSTPPAPLQADTAAFDSTAGHTIWVNGSPVASNADTHPISSASEGAIGRAYVLTATSGKDQRFRGDVAEVVIYDQALVDSDRKAIDAYLKKHWNQW